MLVELYGGPEDGLIFEDESPVEEYFFEDEHGIKHTYRYTTCGPILRECWVYIGPSREEPPKQDGSSSSMPDGKDGTPDPGSK